MTLFELIRENVFALLDDAFKNDAEYKEVDKEIQKLESSSEEFRRLVSGDSPVNKYVELLNRRSARVAELAYDRGMMDVIEFINLRNGGSRIGK